MIVKIKEYPWLKKFKPGTAFTMLGDNVYHVTKTSRLIKHTRNNCYYWNLTNLKSNYSELAEVTIFSFRIKSIKDVPYQDLINFV